MRRLLFLSRWYPYPADNGSKLRIYSLLRGLSREYRLTLLSYASEASTPPEPGPLSAICDEVRTVPYRPFDPSSRRARLGFLSLTPRSVLDTYSAEMEALIRDTLRNGNTDLVVASQIDMAVYSRAFGDTPAVFEELEAGVLHDQFRHAPALRQRMRHGLTWAKYRYYLRRLLHDYALCTVVSGEEQQLLARAVPDFQRVAVIPNCIEVASYRPFARDPQPNTLIFTGSLTYAPNYEAMRWFVAKVLPLVRAAILDVRLTITGDPGNRALPLADGVTLTGFVPDVRPLVAGAWASLAPIHQGGGTRLKILEAMALGTPVVATSKGAEGLDVTDGEHLLLGDSAEAFAGAVIRLLQDQGLRAQLAKRAQVLVGERYDWAKSMPQLLALLDGVARKRTVETVRTKLVGEGQA
ncbi:MAG: glycosyltransferase [Anaerolineae bacterium]|nr:glycosyltransferase [Anaerolineae bacterium]